MKFDKNLVSTILENEFWDDMYGYAEDSVMELDDYDLGRVFERDMDCAKLDTIEQISVYSIEQEKDEGDIIVSGELGMELELMGCVYYDGDYECVETARAWMSFTFGFRNENGKNGEFWMERGEFSPA